MRFLCLLATSAFLFCFFAEYHWVAELAVHWRLHLAAGALAFASLLLIKRRLWLSAYMVLLACGFFWPALQALSPPPAIAGEPNDRATLLQFNVYFGNEDFASKAVPWIIAQDADIVVLQEINAARALELGLLKAHYGWSRIEVNANRDAFGMAIFSRLPVREYRIATTQERWNHYAYMDVVLPSGAGAHLYVLHTPPPVHERFAAQRDSELAFIGKTLAADKAPYRLLAGDLNTSIYSPHFRDMAARAGLDHTQRGWRTAGTWPRLLPDPLRISIDHLLVSNKIRAEIRTPGPELGSDHLPVTTRLVFY